MRTEPKIRFKEFTDAWEQRKFKDIAGRQSRTSDDSNLPSVEYEDIVSGFGRLNKNLLEKDSGKKGILFNSGDVLFGKLRPYLKNWLFATFDGLAVGDWWVLRPKNVSPIFLYNLIQSQRFENVSNLSSGSKMPRSDWKIVSETDFSIPGKLEEQSQIGAFFQSLDHLIALHQRKLNELKSFKLTMLSKMFPKHGQTFPEIRLAGFDGEWERTKLGALGSVAMNKRIFKDETSEDGEIPFYKIGTFGGVADSFISRARFEEYKQKYPYPEIGDILISASGSIGRTVEYMGEEAYYQDSNIVWLKHDNRLVNSFLKQFYSIVKWNGIEGTTIKRLYNKNILETEIPLPSPEEQQAIGELFSNLDDLISSTQSKIGELKTLKKKLLREMFI